MKKVAVINHDFSGFTGSEIVTLEVANYFSSRGCQVVIRAERYSDIYLPYLAENVTISNGRIDVSDFDVVWSQHGHFALNTNNLSDLKGWSGIFIASHLSSSTPAEAYHYPFSAKYAGGVVFNAERVKKSLTEKHKARGVVRNFKNAAPQIFHAENVRRPNTLKNLLIVSNHLPIEVEEAAKILQERGINCRFLGIQGTFKLIDPSDIASADAVISIGKTVQYSLVGGCPVYCYDHFGGPGWLTPDNFHLAEVRNFCGKCTASKKDAKTIAEEILTGYQSAKDYTENNLKFFQERYNLEAILDDFLREIEQGGHGNYICDQESLEQIDLMRGAFCHVSWIWPDVFSKDLRGESDITNGILEKVNELKDDRDLLAQPSWIRYLLRSPWQVSKWNKIRRLQRRLRRSIPACGRSD